MFDFFFFFFLTAAGGAICFSSSQIVNTPITNSSCDDRRSISTYTQPTANPLGVGQGQPVQMTASRMSGGSMVYRGRELAGGVLYGLVSNLKKNYVFAIRGGSRNFVIYFVHTSGQSFFSSFARPATTTCHRPLCQHGGPGMGRST